MDSIFREPRERGSREWETFKTVQNDLRPMPRVLERAIEKNFRREFHAGIKPLDTSRPLSNDDQRRAILKGYQ